MTDETGYVVDGAQAAPALTAAFAAWQVECEKVEALRLKYSPDAAPWRPAEPNTLPVPRPSWLAKALEAEGKVRDRERAAEEAEQIRRSKCNVTRGEFEDLMRLLGVSVQSVADAQRQQAAMDHLAGIEQRGREREAAEAAREPERLRQMNEEKDRARVRWSESERHWSEQEAAEQAARRRFR